MAIVAESPEDQYVPPAVLELAKQATETAEAAIAEGLPPLAVPGNEQLTAEVAIPQINSVQSFPVPADKGQGRIALLEQQFRTLRSKYDIEVPRMSAELRQKDTTISQLQTELETATAQPTITPASVVPVTVQNPKERYGLDDSEADYDEDLLGATSKIAQTEVSQAIGPLVEELKELRAQMDRSGAQQFLVDVKAGNPNWEAVNASPEFNTWLDTTAPMTGVTYRTLYDDAASQCDSRRVLEIFGTYALGRPIAPLPRSSVESQIVPSSVGGNAFAGSPVKLNYTLSQIRALSEKSARMANGTLEEQRESAQLLAELSNAALEGRIVGQ